MGVSQSGPKVITVETGHGDTDVTVSEDFVQYITQKSNNSDEPLPKEPFSEPPPRAQDLLRGGTPTLVDNQWQELYMKEQKKNEEYKTVTQKEFEEIATSVKNQLNESKAGQLIPLCEDVKDLVLNCYNTNTNKTLHCSNEVRQYFQCVEKARKGLLVQTLP